MESINLGVWPLTFASSFKVKDLEGIKTININFMFQEECEKWCEFDMKLCREYYERCASKKMILKINTIIFLKFYLE